MKAKLLIISQVSEELVATFRTPSEAFHCGSLLAASTENENLMYYVQYRDAKGVNKRQIVDPFTRRLPFLNTRTKSDLINYYSSYFK